MRNKIKINKVHYLQFWYQNRKTKLEESQSTLVSASEVYESIWVDDNSRL